MSRPYFSVVIPTKNRSNLVGFALRGILQQKLQDFELVIVDNDDGEETGKVITQIRDDRIRYYRTGALSMPDNWEYGVKRAEGSFILILEDKMILKRNALAEIKDALDSSGCKVATWAMGVLVVAGDDNSLLLRERKTSGGRKVLDAEYLIRKYTADEVPLNDTSQQKKWLSEFPLGTRCCFARKLREEIASGPLRRVCSPAAPDYTLCFAVLAYTSSVMHIDKVLVIEHSQHLSNGRNFRKNKQKRIGFIEEIGGERRMYAYVPIKALIFPNNMLINDYEYVRRTVTPRLDEYPFDAIKYFSLCYIDIQKAIINDGLDMSDELKEWWKAYKVQPVDVKSAVARYLRSVGWPLGWRMLVAKIRSEFEKLRKALCVAGARNRARMSHVPETASEHTTFRSISDYLLSDECNGIAVKKS